MINNINGLFVLFFLQIDSLEIHLVSVLPQLRRRGGSASRADGSFGGQIVHLKWAVRFRVNSADAEKFVPSKGTAGQLPCCSQVLRELCQHPEVVPWQTSFIPRGRGDVPILPVLVYLPSAQSALISHRQPSLSLESLQLLPQCPLLGVPKASGGDGTLM